LSKPPIEILTKKQLTVMFSMMAAGGICGIVGGFERSWLTLCAQFLVFGGALIGQVFYFQHVSRNATKEAMDKARKAGLITALVVVLIGILFSIASFWLVGHLSAATITDSIGMFALFAGIFSFGFMNWVLEKAADESQ
jgi:hypothetical protein